jgi:hypothetical protein
MYLQEGKQQKGRRKNNGKEWKRMEKNGKEGRGGDNLPIKNLQFTLPWFSQSSSLSVMVLVLISECAPVIQAM